MIGAGRHAEGLLALQLHSELGVEPEEVDEFGCGINLCLDHGLALLGWRPGLSDPRQATASSEKGTKASSGLIKPGPRTEEGQDLMLGDPNLPSDRLIHTGPTDQLAEVRHDSLVYC